MTKEIQLHKPTFNYLEIKNLKNCIKSGWVSNRGKFVEDFKRKLKLLTGAKYVIPTINGTAALHVSLKICGVKKGDEVIVPSLTYIASVNAIRYSNASPIFMDSEDDLNISVKKVLKFINENTYMHKGNTYNKKTNNKISALIAVHIFGNAVDLKPILKICRKKNIKVIEDAAESLGTFYNEKYFNKKRHTGTLGDVGCLSFNGNKIISTGGGGAILTNHKKLYLLGDYLCDQAKDDKVFSIHNNIGFNYKLSNIHSAVGCAQLKKLNRHLLKKKIIHENYNKLLKNNKNYEILRPKNFFNGNNWLNILIFKNKKKKINLSRVVAIFKKNNIEIRPIWNPGHKQLPYKNFQKYELRKVNKIVKTYLCLPSSPDLSIKDQNKICRIIKSI